jgi:23S rRNA pseudouridine2604 synthase
MSEPIRIEKYLSSQNIMSRREAKSYLEKGLIKINGEKASSGQKIHPEKDTLEYHPSVQKMMSEKTTVAVHKPRGVISSKDTDKGRNIFDVFPQFTDLNTVGRLDKESEGLILLSNDGLVTKAVTGKDHVIEKEYRVIVRERVTAEMMRKMSSGIRLEDGWTLPAKAVKKDAHTFHITLREGRKHQIRRMSNACRLTIESLKRIRIDTIQLGKMLPGNFRNISDDERSSLLSKLQ